MKAAFQLMCCAFVATAASLAAVAAAPAGPEQPHVKAELLADASAAKPGATFRLGVLLTLDPHWHVYWINPGDSGRATTVKFQAPAGVTVGELQYPLPIRFDQPGDVVGYGYEGKVLLTADVTVPNDATPGSEIKISADVTWLVCKDVCIPGKAKLGIVLPVSDSAAKAHERAFVEWADRWPRRQDPAVKHGAWQAQGNTLTYTVDWASPPAKVELFPGRLPEMEIEKVDIRTDKSTTRATLAARVFAGQTLTTDKLPSLLVYTTADGVRRGVNIDVPLGSLRPDASARRE